MAELLTSNTTPAEALQYAAGKTQPTVIIDTTDGDFSEFLQVYVPSVVTLSMADVLSYEALENILINTPSGVKVMLAPTLWSNLYLLPEGLHRKAVELLEEDGYNVIVYTVNDEAHRFNQYAKTLLG